MKRLFSILLLCALLVGCSAAKETPEQTQYTASFLDVFVLFHQSSSYNYLLK